jgi:hypothetical protein
MIDRPPAGLRQPATAQRRSRGLRDGTPWAAAHRDGLGDGLRGARVLWRDREVVREQRNLLTGGANDVTPTVASIGECAWTLVEAGRVERPTIPALFRRSEHFVPSLVTPL